MKNVFLLLLLLLLTGIAYGQSSPPANEPEKQKPAEKAEIPPPAKAKEEIKTVPSAKGGAKPERVSAKNPNKARPNTPGPARSSRPAARTVRPGRGNR